MLNDFSPILPHLATIAEALTRIADRFCPTQQPADSEALQQLAAKVDKILACQDAQAEPPEPEKEFYTVDEAAEKIEKWSVFSIRERCRHRVIDAHKNAKGRWQIPRYEVERICRDGKLPPIDR